MKMANQIKAIDELLIGKSFKDEGIKVKVILLDMFKVMEYDLFMELLENLYINSLYDIKKCCTDVTDFQKYILS